MSVEKMHFVNIAGRIQMMDRFILKAIIAFDIQFENAMDILDSVKGLYPFTDSNPYEQLNKKVTELLKVLDYELHYDSSKSQEALRLDILESEIDGYERQLETIRHISKSLKSDLEHKKEIRKQILPIQNLEIEVDQLFHFRFMKFRFGKLPKDSYEKLNNYIESLDTIAFKVSEEAETVYLIYFTPRSQQKNIDSLFASLFFERIRISDDVKGKPKEALLKLNEEIEELEARIAMLDKDAKDFVMRNLLRLQQLYNFTIQLNEVFDVRRYAVRSKDAFYITGWLPASQLKEFENMVEEMESVSCIIEDDDAVKKSAPPTRLKNHWFFRPFESLVKMYGTPSYKEADPTPFVAITYLLFFGFMFGDLGQGALITLFSFYLYKKKGNSLGKLGIYIGLMSCLTGVFYGSFFGNEDLLPKLLPFIPMINPMEYKSQMLIVTIAFGVLLILIAMLLNIINSFRQENFGKLFFDRNGIAGLFFYVVVLVIAVSVLSGIKLPLALVLVFTVLPLVFIFFSHPLQNALAKKEHFLPEDKGGFLIEAFFELIETLLALLSNTISFMRIGAFALSHVGFFMAFHTLSDMVGSSGKIPVMIIGNILVIALEGLIVAIQGLRLEYYELFSRFYEADGIEFKPFKIKEHA